MQLMHYTLQTGDGRLSDRSEVRDDIIDLLRPLIQQGEFKVPGYPKLRVIVSFGDLGGAVFTVWLKDAPLVTCGLAETQEQSDDLWPELTRLARNTQTLAPDKPPKYLPWLSVVIMPATIFMAGPDIAEMLGDLERCIAWTLIESKEPPR